MTEKQIASSVYDSLFEGQNTFSEIIEIEQGILAALLCPSFQLLNMYFPHLKPEYFENQILRSLLKVVLEHFIKFKKYPSLDIIEHEIRNSKSKVKAELLDEYIGTIDKLERLLSDSTELDYYRDSILVFLRKVFLREQALELLSNLSAANYDDKKVDSIVHNITHPPSLDVDIGIDLLSLKKLPRDFMNTVPTYFDSLDACLKGGGLGKKQLGVIGGISGVGKSSLLIQFGAAALIRGKNVLHYTLELDGTIIAERYAQRLSGYEELYGHTEDEYFDNAVIYKLGKYGRFGGSLTIKDMDDCRVMDIEAHINRVQMIKGINPNLILIDSPDDMEPNQEYRDMRTYERYWKIYKEILVNGKKFDVPTWIITQFTKDALHKNGVTLKHNSDSWKKVAKATLYIGISQTQEEEKRSVIRITILKNTHGARKYVSILLELDLDTMMIRDKGYVDDKGNVIEEPKEVEYFEEKE